MTLTRLIEEALSQLLRKKAKTGRSKGARNSGRDAEIEERNRLMEALLQRTAGFRVGRKATREEMNAR